MNELETMQFAVYAMRGAVASAPEDFQKQIAECVAKIDEIVEEYGDVGKLAVILAGAEQNLKNLKEKVQ